MKLLKNTFILALLSLVAVFIVACGGTVDAQLGGSVTGLTGGTVVLTNSNNGDTVSVSSNTTFTFPTKLAPNTPYNVIALSPSGQDCSNITNGSGTISSSGADVTNIQVSCKAGSNAPVPICVTAVGLVSPNFVVLVLNNFTSHPLNVAANQTQALCFNDQLTPGMPYSISIIGGATGCNVTIPSGGSGLAPSTGSVNAMIKCGN